MNSAVDDQPSILFLAQIRSANRKAQKVATVLRCNEVNASNGPSPCTLRFTHQMNIIDFSNAVISAMEAKYKHLNIV